MLDDLLYTNAEELVVYNKLKALDVKDKPALEKMRLYLMYSLVISTLEVNRDKVLIDLPRNTHDLQAGVHNRLQGYTGNLVFVYGTLKQGCRNHDKIQGTFLGKAQTVYDYSMYSYDGQFPYLTEKASLNMHKVHGELYEVSDEVLGKLDKFEGVDEKFYYRTAIIAKLQDGEEVAPYTYFMSNTVEPVIPIDLWEE